jgi:hypothetical protein
VAGNIPDWLHSAYTAIRAAETNKSLSPMTLDHLLQEKIDSIQGGDTRSMIDYTGKALSVGKQSKLDILDSIDVTIDAIVAAIQQAGSDPTKLRALGFSVPDDPESVR